MSPLQDDQSVDPRPPSSLPLGEEPPPSRFRHVGQAVEQGMPRVYLARGVLEFMERCARRPEAEAVAGVLVGRAFRNAASQVFVLVEGAIEAPEVEAASRSVKFTARSWQAVREMLQDRFGSRRAVGWFHARPGEAMQLSPYETFVHQTHFGAGWQFACVLDPQTAQLALWGWRGEVLEPLPGYDVWESEPVGLFTGADVKRAGYFPAEVQSQVAAGAEGAEQWQRGTWPVARAQARIAARRRAAREQAPRWGQAVSRALQGATVLALVFVSAMVVRWGIDRLWPAAGRPGAPAGGQQAAGLPRPGAGAAEPADAVRAGRPAPPTGATEIMGGVPGAPPAPQETPAAPFAAATPERTDASGTSGPAGGPASSDTLTYQVQRGDTLWGVAQRFYGDPGLYRWLAEVNSVADPAHIEVGRRLLLPPRGAEGVRRK
ncbi:LysM peptidoglycan-binding domain-containing protein [Carboxydochorda subterranea]|uniref:LysM peptidoglycan-binding domain-containing protein n=1 Tax=Carboxydichorda subterranea TaxID=3109565 RepID=A0ABZ1BYI6_9FIRM|nr:LysM peptidoglycan-binding domain-containing protein [Limnochorda sp. L945t]WRP17783.1 LysM peptidoglycan-binding domain-containing protein [Limnochorda sp. L945t]